MGITPILIIWQPIEFGTTINMNLAGNRQPENSIDYLIEQTLPATPKICWFGELCGYGGFCGRDFPNQYTRAQGLENSQAPQTLNPRLAQKRFQKYRDLGVRSGGSRY